LFKPFTIVSGIAHYLRYRFVKIVAPIVSQCLADNWFLLQLFYYLFVNFLFGKVENWKSSNAFKELNVIIARINTLKFPDIQCRG